CWTLSDPLDEAALCEGGDAYLLLTNRERQSLQLVDVVTHQPRRVFTPRAYVHVCVWRCCADWRVSQRRDSSSEAAILTETAISSRPVTGTRAGRLWRFASAVRCACD